MKKPTRRTMTRFITNVRPLWGMQDCVDIFIPIRCVRGNLLGATRRNLPNEMLNVPG